MPHYATNPEPSYTAISGCSLGGLVSIFASYYYPEVFHQYISLSASFWYEDVLRYLQGEKIERQGNIQIKPTVNRQDHQLYLYVGELEGIYKETIQSIWLTTRRRPTLNLSRKAIWNLDYHLRQIQKELMMTCSFLTTSFNHFVGYLAWKIKTKRLISLNRLLHNSPKNGDFHPIFGASRH